MKTDILIIGGGASGLMAAWSAASRARLAGEALSVTVLEKMPRPGRKLMITGKGRCNFTNVKDWEDFSAHIASRPNFIKNAFMGFDSRAVLDFFESHGMKTVVERGDRAFPASYHASEVVDTLVNACKGEGVKIETSCEVLDIICGKDSFEAICREREHFIARRIIIATGGLSYPASGSSGDGFRFASQTGHKLLPVFPSLTALVPSGYKDDGSGKRLSGHIHRETPLSATGEKLCGIQLKNVGAKLVIQGNCVEDLFGDIDFTDGGIEGPLGFQMSRACIKALINGGKAAIILDLKPQVGADEVKARVNELWNSVCADPRSRNLREKEKCRILLGKLMPWDLIPAFTSCHPEILTLEKRGRRDTKVWVNLATIAKALKEWRFEIDGYVGWERAVITAGGISNDDMIPKTMESRKVHGMYFCGEVTDVDCSTGGYNLQAAFSTGFLAGASAVSSLL